MDGWEMEPARRLRQWAKQTIDARWINTLSRRPLPRLSESWQPQHRKMSVDERIRTMAAQGVVVALFDLHSRVGDEVFTRHSFQENVNLGLFLSAVLSHKQYFFLHSWFS
jgi:hypothetical protein